MKVYRQNGWMMRYRWECVQSVTNRNCRRLHKFSAHM